VVQPLSFLVVGYFVVTSTRTLLLEFARVSSSMARGVTANSVLLLLAQVGLPAAGGTEGGRYGPHALHPPPPHPPPARR
jgi:hypothetical protein